MAEGPWQERKQRARVKVARAIAKRVGLVAKKRTHCSVVSYAIDEDDGESIEGTPDNDEELQAWCLLEESEHEQWQIGDQQTRQTKF